MSSGHLTETADNNTETKKEETEPRSSTSSGGNNGNWLWEKMKDIGVLNLLLLCIPIAAGLYGAKVSPVAQFIFSALAVMPLAELMGDSTEVIAEYAGPGIGGLLNATFGNAAELILGLFSVFNNLDDLVKASITGSIIGNALLVSGMSMFAGGIQKGGRLRVQTFNRGAVGTTATTAVMASVALTIPAVTKYVGTSPNSENHLSVGVAVVLIISYVTMLIFSLITHKEWFNEGEEDRAEKKRKRKRVINRKEGSNCTSRTSIKQRYRCTTTPAISKGAK